VTTLVEQIEHTADIGIRVRASSPEEAFEAAALGMFDIVAPSRRIADASERSEVRLTGDGWADLLVKWLEELLFIYEIDGLVPIRAEVDRIGPHGLEAHVSWHCFNPAPDQRGVEIKAVTYHMLKAGPTADGFEAQVIFDI
jgi:SHS2 domain-containing protein